MDQVDSTGNTTMMNLRFNVPEQNPTCAPIRAECVLSMIESLLRVLHLAFDVRRS